MNIIGEGRNLESYLPWNLQDVIDRLADYETVYGFELELLASTLAE